MHAQQYPNYITDKMQYSFTNIKKMEPLLDMRIQEWTNKLDEKFVKSGEAFDFSWWAV